MTVVFEREVERVETLAHIARVPAANRAALIEEYRVRSEAAFAPETLRNYRLIVRLFSEWCALRGYDPQPPVSPQVLANWVDDMGGKLAANTIETRLWGLAELHKSQFLPSPCRHRLVELALKGVKRKYGATQRQAPPLGKKDVERAITSLGHSRRDVRDIALLWIAGDSWCRASEIVSLKVRDLIRQDDMSSLLYIAKSKTDQFGEGAYAYLSPRGTNATLDWIELAGLSSDDPILTKSQVGGLRTPLVPSSVSRIMKRCTGRSDVSAHSTRVGGVHDAFRLGCDISSIMVAGRWSSPEMPAQYGRRIRVSQSAAAQVSRAFEDALLSTESPAEGP